MSLAAAVDGLYHDVVTEPERWNEPAFAEWLEAVSLDSGAIELRLVKGAQGDRKETGTEDDEKFEHGIRETACGTRDRSFRQGLS